MPTGAALCVAGLAYAYCCACTPSLLQELEARLLQSERERDSARAQLHELTLSMRTEGEFGNAGKRLRWALLALALLP